MTCAGNRSRIARCDRQIYGSRYHAPVSAATAPLIQHWDINRPPYDGEADRGFDPLKVLRELCRASPGAPRVESPYPLPRAPTDLRSLLGKPPLLEGEDVAQYEALAREIDDAVQPNDAIEKIWARDLTDLTREMLRLRRARDQLMRSSAYKGLSELLRPLVPFLGTSDLCSDWAKREPEAVQEVDRVLAKAGMDQQAIAAHTLRAELPTLEKIENLIARAEARRHAILREFDRRRDVIERRLRNIAEGVQDAEFKELPSRDGHEG